MQTKAFCAVLASMVAVGGSALWSLSKSNASVSISAPGETSLATPLPSEVADLPDAIARGVIAARFTGNGRDKMRATLSNPGVRPLKIQADLGQMLESGTNGVVVVRATPVEVPPGSSAEMHLQTVATRSSNSVALADYTLSDRKETRLDGLLVYAQAHPAISLSSIQTAVLALTENLPLSAISRFAPAAGELKSRFNTDPFRTETADIVTALIALRALGVVEPEIAMTVDPQLKIEAMIEPMSRVAAMSYYGITPGTEWDYWKNELLSGAPSTRHYALYGIARFYPDIALQMLPTWARQVKTNTIYRLSAVQALADTQRAEALPLLRQLSDEFGTDTELGRAAHAAAKYLDQRLSQLAGNQPAIAFRSSKTVSQF